MTYTNGKMMFFGISIIYFFSFQSTDAAAVDPTSYLRSYGYLNSNGYAGVNSIQSALQSYQNFAGIPVTGKLDDATKKQMTISRCGNADHRVSGYKSIGLSWSKNDLTYRFDNFSPDLSQTVIRNVMQQAFDMWSGVTPLQFTLVGGSKADIVIGFERFNHGDGSDFDGKGGTLAHAFYPEEGVIHFDDSETFTDGLATGTNLLWVAVHEIGHALGLDHSPNKKAIMYPYYRSVDANFNSLTNIDIADIQSIYGGLPCKDRIFDCSYAVKLGHCTKYPTGMAIKCRKSCNYC